MKISQLYVYPIKSLRGTAVESAEVGYQGLKHDRRFMLVKTSPKQENMLVAEYPEMCLFLTKMVYPIKQDPASGKVIVTYVKPGSTEQKTLEVPLQPETEALDKMEITLHSSSTHAYNMGQNYNQWFSECFGYEVIFVYLGENRRQLLGNMTPAVTWKQHQQQSWMSNLTSKIPYLGDAPGVDDGIGFADVAPYLVVTEKSWENANARLPVDETLEITKFRPNIVVEGAEEEFEEDFWAELEIGETLKIVLTQNCSRCKSINIDFATGKPGTTEAGSMLKKLQKDRRVDSGSRWSPIFGRYGFLDKVAAGSRIGVGDEVKVLRKNRERSVFGELDQLSQDSM
jgi:uncharacterized protein YcbX